MESLYANSSSIRDKRHRRESSTQVKEGTSAILLQSGLDEKWWADSQRMFLLSAQRSRPLIREENSLQTALAETFCGPVFPFRSMIEYHPISAKFSASLHLFGKEAFPGIFTGYVLNAGWNLERRYFGWRRSGA